MLLSEAAAVFVERLGVRIRMLEPDQCRSDHPGLGDTFDHDVLELPDRLLAVAAGEMEPSQQPVVPSLWG